MEINSYLPVIHRPVEIVLPVTACLLRPDSNISFDLKNKMNSKLHIFLEYYMITISDSFC